MLPAGYLPFGMPTDVYDDGLDLQIGLLEAAMPDSPERRSALPYPFLLPTGEEEMRRFRTVVLENSYLKAVVVPGLGGRVLSLFDKRTGTEILARYAALLPQPGGRRGAFLREGIQLRLDSEDRLNSLGNVATQPDPAPEEEMAAAVWIAETAGGTGLSFHLRLEMPPDRAELRFEIRVLNRTFEPLPYDGALALHVGDGELRDGLFYSEARDAGFFFEAGETPLDLREMRDGALVVGRFPEPRRLAPRQVDTWSLRLVPFSGLGAIPEANAELAARLAPDRLTVQTAAARTGHKLVLLTQDGQTLEAPADLYPERILEIPLDGLPSPARALVVLDPAREEVLRTGVRPETSLVASEPAEAPAAGLGLETDEATLRRATFDVGRRHLAYTLLGTQALARRDFSAAQGLLEQALLYNAEDPLVWWAKAMAARLAGDEAEERAELLNAHYLAPLEPALRAESFLNLGPNLGKEPSPLLGPLEENPEEFVEVACLLLDAGLYDEATRWIDESLRHRDLAMLRYLQAYAFLVASRMAVEAAEHVAAAARLPFGPPFPYRAVERTALRFLARRFPNDATLARYRDLIEAG